MKKACKNIYVYIFLLVISVVCSLLIFNSSPIFNGVLFNDDSVFRIIGQGVLKGKVPYKDLFDHKGPMLYFIEVIALIINKNFGLFIVEVIFNFVSLVYIYKIANIYFGKIGALFFPIIYELVLPVLVIRGNMTEEYACTIMFIAIYYIILILNNDKRIKSYHFLMLGFLCSINFLIKPTYVYVWIAFVISYIFLIIKRKDYKSNIKKCVLEFLNFAIGFLSVVLAVLIYFAYNNAINEFIYSYFTFNFKYSNSSIVDKILNFAILLNYYGFMIALISTVLLLIIYGTKEKQLLLFMTINLLIAYIFSAMAPNFYEHYILNIIPAILIIIIVLGKNVDIYDIFKIKKKGSTILLKLILVTLVMILIVFCFLNYFTTNETYKNIFPKRELNSLKEKFQDKSILVLGNSPQLYIVFERDVDFKYFYQYPIAYYDENVFDHTIQYIKTEKPDILVLDRFFEKAILLNEKLIETIQKEGYVIINNEVINYYKLNK